jgi:molybdopterin/thiamine biosynthesis adenylyltransferase
MQYQRTRKLIDIEKLRKKTVTIVGLGSLGSFTAVLLAKNGVNLNLIDFDRVSIENLSSQIYSRKDIKKYKTKALSKYLKKLNPQIIIKSLNIKLSSANLKILDSDLVIDCTDNLDVRFLIDSYCYNKIPWIHTAAIRTLGLVYVVNNSLSDLYNSSISEDLCDEHGILNTVASMTASIAATQAIKILLGLPHEKNLVRFNIWNNTFDKIKIKPLKKKEIQIIKLCRSNYSVNLHKELDLNVLSKRYKTLLKRDNIIIIKPKIIINRNGYIIFENSSREEIKKWLKSL